MVAPAVEVGQSQTPYKELSVDTILSFGSFDITNDPTMPDRVQTGLTIAWLCKRASESWPTISPSIVYHPSPVFGGNGGCFGDGPGTISSFASLTTLTIDSSYMQPTFEYTLRMQLNKNKKAAVYDVTLNVLRPPTPSLSIT